MAEELEGQLPLAFGRLEASVEALAGFENLDSAPGADEIGPHTPLGHLPQQPKALGPLQSFGTGVQHGVVSEVVPRHLEVDFRSFGASECSYS